MKHFSSGDKTPEYDSPPIGGFKDDKLPENIIVDNDKQFTIKDMRAAFEAGDKFRLYLDKNVMGLADKDTPSSDVVLDTMDFDNWIKNIKQ